MDGIGRIDLTSVDAAPVDTTSVDTGPADASKRARKRDSMFLTARLALAGEPTVHEVRVRNLSEGGLMAELDRKVEPGTAVTLEMRGVGRMTGRVAWFTRGRVGIALDTPIDPSRARKPVGTGAQTPVYAKPIVIGARRR